MRWAHLLALGLAVAARVPARPAELTVGGPIAAAAAPGDPSRNYPFGAAHVDLARYGYREDEFFVETAAVLYASDGRTTATIAPDEPYPYKTRVIVRRPLKAAAFNGTVILEWINSPAPPEAANRAEQQNEWCWSYEHLMRTGYVYVGFSAQPPGVEQGRGLRNWNPARYGTLNVSAGGKFGPHLSKDVLSQLARELKRPTGTPLLGGLHARNVVASGHSAGAAQLIAYYNSYQPLAGAVDGFVFHGFAAHVRTDIRTPAWKLLAERDGFGDRAERQPDADFLRTWEVAGAAHADWDLVKVLEVLFDRDERRQGQTQCDQPRLSRVPARLVQAAVYDAMKRWIEKGTAPPHAPPITESGGGGIRLAAVDVPIATNTGANSGGPYCGIMGAHVPFDAPTLARLYPTHAAYAAAVTRVTDANYRAGFLTKDGAAEIKREAARSAVGVR
jgi:hypothetical protein